MLLLCKGLLVGNMFFITKPLFFFLDSFYVIGSKRIARVSRCRRPPRVRSEYSRAEAFICIELQANFLTSRALLSRSTSPSVVREGFLPNHFFFKGWLIYIQVSLDNRSYLFLDPRFIHRELKDHLVSKVKRYVISSFRIDIVNLLKLETCC